MHRDNLLAPLSPGDELAQTRRCATCREVKQVMSPRDLYPRACGRTIKDNFLTGATLWKTTSQPRTGGSPAPSRTCSATTVHTAEEPK